MFPIPVEPGKYLDVLGEGEEIEGLDPTQCEPAGSDESVQVRFERVETTGEIDETIRRSLGERLSQQRVQPPPWRIDDHGVGAVEQCELFARRPRDDRRPRALRLGSSRQPELEPAQPSRAAFVESNRFRVRQQAEPDGTDAAVGFRDRPAGWDERADSTDCTLEERQVVLSERIGWKEYFDPPDRFPGGRLASQPDCRGAQDRVAPFGLAIEEESLEPVPELIANGLGERTEDIACRATAHEHDLDALRSPLHDELDITQRSTMRSIGVGFDAGLANRCADPLRRVVDQWMVYRAAGDVDYAVTVDLEESDLWAACASAYGQPSPVAMAAGGCAMHGGLGQARGRSDSVERRPGLGGQIARTEARAAGTGWAMGAVFDGGHRRILARRPLRALCACGRRLFRRAPASRSMACEACCYAAAMKRREIGENGHSRAGRGGRRGDRRSGGASGRVAASRGSGSSPAPPRAAFLPTTAADLEARGWERADVVFVTGDAYVDHPSFAMAILGRWLEAHGYRVAILSQPDWRSAEPWRALGRPRLFYAVSAGNMDSMINHYTANRKRRNADAYSPGGRIGLRPDRPTAVYAQRCREAWKGVPVITGGVEASLRRVAHYDYWSDRVWPSNLVTSKADLLGFGMGEATLVEIAQRLDAGEPLEALRDLSGVAYLLGKNETLPEPGDCHASGGETIALPDFESVREDPRAFAEMTRRLHHETNPHNARRLTQRHGDRLLVVNPPAPALSEATLDRLYGLPYTRHPHPDCEAPPPAWETIRDSIQIMRGCFGGCTFCSITLHQGREIQSRSADSVLAEVEELAAAPDWKGGISDLGGPTANMYRMGCSEPSAARVCRRLSCVHPGICKLLDTDHAATIDLMRRARAVPGVKRVHIASGIRMDLAADSPEYLEELAAHHVGGHLKVAPEHVSDRVLELMKKPGRASFDRFAARFAQASQRAGKEQYLVPYFISSHPGSSVEDMIELAIFLKERGYRPRQVQDFIPAPMDVATCMYWTGIDPLAMKPVESAKRPRDRDIQRALLQFFAPENWATVRDALRRAGREDLIGEGPDCLIPSRAPRRTRGDPRSVADAGDSRSGSGGDQRSGGYRAPSRRRGRGRQRAD